jgi:tetratricopeptide (TPR) repeat protein
MVSSRGKRFALGAVTLGALALGVSSLVFWRDLEERWYLRKLESGAPVAKGNAARRLGEIHSLRAIPAFQKALEGAGEELQKEIVKASKQIGPEAAPVVFQVVQVADKNRALSNIAVQALTGMGPAKTIGEASKNPEARMRFADALANLGRSAEALEEYLWCMDRREENSILFRVRQVTDEAIYRIARLGDTYPPAREALRERRDRLGEKIIQDATGGSWLKRFVGGVSLMSPASQFARLSNLLDEEERIVPLFDKLKGTTGTGPVRKFLLHFVIDNLLAERRYSDVLEAAGDVQAELTGQFLGVRIAGGMRGGVGGGEAQTHLQKFLVREAGKYYQAFLAAGKTESAASIARLLIGYSVTSDTYAVLVGRAILAGSRDEAQKLLEEAGRTLPAADLQVVKEAETHPEKAVALDR